MKRLSSERQCQQWGSVVIQESAMLFASCAKPIDPFSLQRYYCPESLLTLLCEGYDFLHPPLIDLPNKLAPKSTSTPSNNKMNVLLK
jgi:hypothetical protein